MVQDSIMEKLRKIKALAENGVGGEVIAAQEALDRLLKEHGLTLEDISDEQSRYYEFKYSNEREMALMMQVLVHLFGSKSHVFRTGRFVKKGKVVFLEMTKLEYIDFKNMWEYYRREWKKYMEKGLKEMLSAYVLKFNLYDITPNPEDKPSERPDFSTIMRIRMMSEGIDADPYAKMIEHGKR